jgi:hypothetical protein
MAGGTESALTHAQCCTEARHRRSESVRQPGRLQPRPVRVTFPCFSLFSRCPSNHVVEPLSEDDLYLLPADIKGFNLSHKVCQHCRRVRGSCPEDMCQSWQKFDVRHLHDVQFDEDAWSHLVLDQDTKVRTLLSC